MKWLGERPDIDGKKLAAWGESFAPTNARDAKFAVPLDAPNPPRVGEPGAALLAYLACLFEDGVTAFHADGGPAKLADLLTSPYLYVPHDAIAPGMLSPFDRVAPFVGVGKQGWFQLTTDANNRRVADPTVTPTRAAARIAAVLK